MLVFIEEGEASQSAEAPILRALRPRPRRLDRKRGTYWSDQPKTMTINGLSVPIGINPSNIFISCRSRPFTACSPQLTCKKMWVDDQLADMGHSGLPFGQFIHDVYEGLHCTDMNDRPGHGVRPPEMYFQASVSRGRPVKK